MKIEEIRSMKITMWETPKEQEEFNNVRKALDTLYNRLHSTNGSPPCRGITTDDGTYITREEIFTMINNLQDIVSNHEWEADF